jgi:hypothetical protein
MRIVLGLVIVILATLLVMKTEWLIQNFGHMQSAERMVGIFGGTRLILKLIGVIFIFVGFLYMTGLHEELLNFIGNLLVPTRARKI